LVADVRAATPSNAAELCVPDRRAVQSELGAQRRALERAMETRMQRAQLRLERLSRGLSEPRSALLRTRERLQRLHGRLLQAAHARLRVARRAVAQRLERLSRRDPRLLCAQDRGRLDASFGRLRARTVALGAARRARLGEQAARLQALSPLSVLARGYAIALHERTGRALLRAADAAPGDGLRLRLHDGELRARVDEP
jgi:exodeoxyribonuclease VII large subunit